MNVKLLDGSPDHTKVAQHVASETYTTILQYLLPVSTQFNLIEKQVYWTHNIFCI